MNTKIALGRAPHNDIVVDAPSVSRDHAYVTFVSEQELLIEDRDSSYGTFINGRRIKQSKLTPADILLLGEHELKTAALFEHFRKKSVEEKTDFSAEFALLAKKFEEYEKKSARLANMDNKRTQTVRLVASVVGVLLVLSVSFSKVDQTIKVVIGSCSGLLATGVVLFTGNKSSKAKNMLGELQAEYETLLLCPKCSNPLINKPLSYWRVKKQCPRCQASWTK